MYSTSLRHTSVTVVFDERRPNNEAELGDKHLLRIAKILLPRMSFLHTYLVIMGIATSQVFRKLILTISNNALA